MRPPKVATNVALAMCQRERFDGSKVSSSVGHTTKPFGAAMAALVLPMPD